MENTSLNNRKTDILSKLKSMNSGYYYKIYEGKVVKSLLDKNFDGSTRSASSLRRELERLEFKIATEALNLKHERELIKEARALESDLKRAEEKERLERKLRFIEEDAKRIKGEIEALQKELDEVSDRIRKEGRARTKDREREPKTAQLPTIKNDDGRVNLGDICVIKKKD